MTERDVVRLPQVPAPVPAPEASTFDAISSRRHVLRYSEGDGRRTAMAGPHQRQLSSRYDRPILPDRDIRSRQDGNAWHVLLAALPQGWREAAKETGAAKRLRKERREDRLLRILLLHVGLGYSLKEAALRARFAGLADFTDAGLHKLVKNSKGWLHGLCVRLYKEQRLAVLPQGASQVRAADALEVVRKEGVSTFASELRGVDTVPVRKRARSRSQWRVHCSVSLPSLACDFFERTKTTGPGTSKSLARFPIRAGDHVLAGRGYWTAECIRHVAGVGGRLIVPVDDTGLLPLYEAAGQRFDLLAQATSVTRAGAFRSWATAVVVPGDDGGPAGEIAGRVWALRRSPEAIHRAHERIREDAARDGTQVQPATLRFAEYWIVFTTLPDPLFYAAHVWEWYQLCAQVELMFRYITKLAQLGRVPTNRDTSRAWVYGKLLVALLVDKLARASGEPPAHVFELVKYAILRPTPRGRRSPNGKSTYANRYHEKLEELKTIMSRC